MNEHEQRQEERRQRYLELADKAEAEIGPISKQFRELNACMNGQPILIGHHSEGRHRKDLERQDKRLSRMVALDKKAQHYRDKAAGVNKAGISSDDTDAIDKLTAKLSGLEFTHKIMRDVNAMHKKYLKHSGILDGSNMPDKYKDLIRNHKPAYSWEPHPFAPYQLQNSNANIKRVKQRIAGLEKASDAETIETEHNGVKVVENVELNRIQLIFDGKPPDDTRQALKRLGFRWSPRETAWQRHLNNNGRYAVKQFLATQEVS